MRIPTVPERLATNASTTAEETFGDRVPTSLPRLLEHEECRFKPGRGFS
jgi:hypothetical protein